MPQHNNEDRQILFSPSSEDNISDAILSRPTLTPTPNERRRYTVIEPAVFLIFTAIALAGKFARKELHLHTKIFGNFNTSTSMNPKKGGVLQNQILYQTCTVIYKYNDTECQPLMGIIPETDRSKSIETKVQPYVARIIMATSLINSILPAFLCLFIGPWSDKFGRRPVLVATFSAALIGHVITTILAGISLATPVNPWVYIISYFPLALTGGTCALVTMLFCLVSDVSDMVGKARRMFFVEGAMGIGTLVGNVLASYILSATGTIGVFALSSAFDLVALVYLLIFVSESLQFKHERKESKIREFFKFDLIKDLVRSCVRRRAHYTRAIVWCTMFTLVTTTFVTQGEANLIYLFLRNKFNITLQQFTTYNSAAIVIKMVGCAIILLLLRVMFKVSLTVVAILGLIGSFLDSTTRAFAQQFWQIYLASVMGFMGGINSPILQAILAGLVDPTEIGKIYAVVSSLQTLSPLLSAPVYTGIYNATLLTYPGALFFLSSGVYLVSFVLITIMFVLQQIGANRQRAQPASAVET